VLFSVIHGFFFSFPSKSRPFWPLGFKANRYQAVWLKWWSDTNAVKPNHNLGMYLGVYSVFQVCAVVCLGLLVWYDCLAGIFRLCPTNTWLFIRHAFTTMTIKSGIKLHWITLTTVTSLVALKLRFRSVKLIQPTGLRWHYFLWSIPAFW
jgi:hypothetical protein